MIRRQSKILAAAASVGLMFGAASLVVADDQNRTGQHTGQYQDPIGQTADRVGDQIDRTADRIGSAITDLGAPALPAGITPKDVSDTKDLRKLLAKTTEAAFDKGGFDAVVKHLNDQDRNRIGEVKFDDAQKEKYDGRIEQIRQAWKARYGEDFAINVASEGEHGPFTAVTFLRGEIQDPALVIQNWPVNARGFASAALDRAAGAVADIGDSPVVPPVGDRPIGDRPAQDRPGTLDEAQKFGGGDVNLDKGREVAVAYLPAVGPHGQPVTVSIIGEIQAWKIDIPNHVDGNKLYDNLLAHLTHFGENEANWPADKVEAQRKAAQCVMMALYDIPMQDSGYNPGRVQDPMQPQQQPLPNEGR